MIYITCRDDFNNKDDNNNNVQEKTYSRDEQSYKLHRKNVP